MKSSLLRDCNGIPKQTKARAKPKCIYLFVFIWNAKAAHRELAGNTGTFRGGNSNFVIPDLETKQHKE